MNRDFTKQTQDKREQKASQGSSSKKKQKVNPKNPKTRGKQNLGRNTRGANLRRKHAGQKHNQKHTQPNRILTCVCSDLYVSTCLCS
uniref:Uncharacterized protein n=1 Tax=Anguilla anguilla TaxID=7936 RepID=A0A0E9STG6_ANGAN